MPAESPSIDPQSAKWFLNKHMLAAIQCLSNLMGMIIVKGCNGNDLNMFIG